jgi:ABC-type transport system involved in cytochrome c biogenesis permease subunit
MSRMQAEQQPLLSLRAAVVFLIGIVTALSVTALRYLSGNPLPAAVLAGGTAFGTSVALAHSIIG